MQGLAHAGPDFRLGLAHWCLWREEAVSGTCRWPNGEILPCQPAGAELGFLPMIQRRRLSPLAAAACTVAWDGRRFAGDMPAVFYSAHGESRYYWQMLEGLAGGEGVSPSRFSLSVHNAIAGLFALQTANFQPYVSLAGGGDGLFAAFLEAAGYLLDVPRVLLVAYEQPLPEAYRCYSASPAAAWALAMVLQRADAGGNRLHFVRQSVDHGGDDGDSDWLEAMTEGKRRGLCRYPHSLWHWSLDDA